jgi:glutaminyl-peptide cyclotransferase
VLAPELFGEGLALHDDRLIQLTWRSHVGFVYDRASFRELRQFTYPTEGWGLASDGKRLILSDGTATLHLLDPTQLRETGTLVVTAQGTPVRNLNELEVVGHVLYANVWQSDRIARIDLASGHVTAWIDLGGILGAERPADREAVLNGIAYDAAHDRLLVTGKRWPKLFAIEIVDGAGRRVAPGAP